ncbi:xanthine dehydrogenase molybdopterin binding subunit [Labrys wisconsinensis]|uniref:Xanthine dehydrogenase large subunit n=1 Tax=Labrys wisconsinensis TaxID=425677 RepID=A0ABU0J4T7_9HYPH|nr:xanthine dehydrogenase molybdopterin binding subunit [Labrys wisconsinensis]MDQ0469280.1 xanthine dehydrogenase large subunit [Labrys wisconsinensis]
MSPHETLAVVPVTDGVMSRSVAHDSAVKHVAGTARYIDDVPEPAGTLHVVPSGAAIAAGRILSIDLAAVRAAPGVVAVLTAADIRGRNDVSPVDFDVDPCFADGRVEFHAQVVFAVVARTRDEGRRAARLARIEYEARAPVVDVDAALEGGTTVMPDYEFRRGDVSRALTHARHRAQGSFLVGGQEHFYLEGQVALATPGEDGDMHVLSSTQHPSEVQHVVARVLGVPDHAVTCEVRRMGGGFGGKESQASQWAAIAAVAAQCTGHPCKLRLDRDDDMAMTGKRHDFRITYDVGFDETGLIHGYDITYAARCGYSADLSLGICDRTMFHADNAYYLGDVHIGTRRMKTNTVSNTAFRGFGGPQGMVGMERTIDAIAWTLGLDPLDVRKRNFYAPGRDYTPYGQRVEDNVLLPLVETLERTSDYRERRLAAEAFNEGSAILKKGIALTPVKFGISFTLMHLNQAGALVHVYSDGSVQLNHGGTEMGQGLYIKVAQVVADEFGIEVGRVRITATTTAKVPNTAPTAASSGADLNAMAAKAAARTIRERMAAVAAGEFAVRPEEVTFRGGRAYGGNRSMTFDELAKKAVLSRVSLSSTGFYRTPKIAWDRANKKGRPFLYFAYGAACSEVTIDTLTGEMKVDRVDILHDVGRSLNPAIDIGQIEGGFVQGMGWLTTEELVFDDKGRLLTHAPSTYKIPTAADVPADFRVALYDNENREDTIGRSKAVGEPPLMLAISVFSAVADAVHALAPGRPVALDAPATPEAILEAVRAARGRS